jgi:hypothetical protein
MDNGAAWLPLVPGVVPSTLAEVAPGNVNPFTHLFATGSGVGNNATVTVQGGVLSIATTTPPSGNGFNLQLFDQAYTPGKTITAWFDSWVWQGSRVGIYISNGNLSSSTQLVTLNLANYNLMENNSFLWNGTTWATTSFSPGTQTGALRTPGPIGLRIVESAGPDYSFQVSFDGITWNTLTGPFSVAAYIGAPSHCGFFIDANGAANDPCAKLLSWSNQ